LFRLQEDELFLVEGNVSLFQGEYEQHDNAFGHIHNQGIQKDSLMKKDYKGLFWVFITFIISWL
jgi:hypothetical protein